LLPISEPYLNDWLLTVRTMLKYIPIEALTWPNGPLRSDSDKFSRRITLYGSSSSESCSDRRAKFLG
jgi:hypothetical protein